MIDGAMVQHAGEAGAGLGGGLVDALPEGLQPEHDVFSFMFHDSSIRSAL